MKKGFTLIELLAVIVILAVIALIATPIILNIIEDSKKQSIKSSANLYVDGLIKQIASKNMIDEFNPTTCIVTNGNVTCDNTSLDYQTNGDKPTSGSISFNNGVVTGYNLTISGYTVTKSGNTVTIVKGIAFNGTKVAASQSDTHKGIVYLDPTNLSTTCTAQLAAANLNDKATPTPTGVTSGCMKFYIYDDSGSTYKMILDHNTSGDVAWIAQADFLDAGGSQTDWNNWIKNTQGPITTNARLAEDTEGWVGNPRLITADEVAHIVGANTALGFDSTNSNSNWFYFDGIGSTYAEWQNSSNDDEPFATASNKSRYAWLYDYTEDCEEYGCNVKDDNLYPYGTKDSENTEVLWCYWTSSARAGSSYGAWRVGYDGVLDGLLVSNDSDCGVRPVIELSKSIIDN